MRHVKGERIGIMRDVVTVQEVQYTRNDTGEAMETWVDIKKVFARADFRQRGSEEIELALQMRPQVTVIFTVRYDPIFTPYHRLLHKGEIYHIDSVLQVEGDMYLQLECLAAEQNV